MRVFPISCWYDFYKKILSEAAYIRNVESAIDLQIGDRLVFIPWRESGLVLTQEVFCVLDDGRFSLRSIRSYQNENNKNLEKRRKIPSVVRVSRMDSEKTR